MIKKQITAIALQQELLRRIHDRARGPYERYRNAEAPMPVPLEQRDPAGCNWTVVCAEVPSPAGCAFIDLILQQLMLEYDLVASPQAA